MNLSYVKRSVGTLLAEGRLIRRAKAGDVDAFAQLYDAYVERMYRYVYFKVPNDSVAKGITFQIFFKAWEELDHYPVFGSPFIEWLYSIAQNQIAVYHQTHKTPTIPANQKLSLTFRGRYLDEEVQGMFDLQALRDGLQFLTQEEQQVLILKFIVKLPNKNIARMMMKRESDVDALQVQALEMLAGHLEEKNLI
ncbi:MAG TPA: RNA polymerase sigma factor [Anaerolineales bacterium]|nr:RNA polymerase sigma factor [Anaerolineales bacterium]